MIIGIEDDLNLGSPRKRDQTMPLSYKAIDNTYAQAFSVTILITTTKKKKKKNPDESLSWVDKFFYSWFIVTQNVG